jgi:hypothetical protein
LEKLLQKLRKDFDGHKDGYDKYTDKTDKRLDLLENALRYCA